MEYELIRSDRRTLAIEIKPDGRIIVKAPRRTSQAAINFFLREKREWIEKAQQRMAERNAGKEMLPKLSEVEKRALKKKAKEMIEPLLCEYSDIMGVDYGNVSYRFQKSRFGSCSGEGNLNFNCLLAMCPEGSVRYVVVHELCHRRHMNHSKAFWEMVEEYMPDYKEHRKWLKANGGALIGRL